MRRLSLAAAAVVAASLVLAGCSSAPASTGRSTVQFLGPEDPATFAPVIAGFEKKNPTITVTYTQVPFDQLSSTLQQRLGAKDTTIDVFAVDQPNVSQLAAQGFLEDLSALEPQAKAATSSAQYKINLYKGKMWALSVWNSTQMLFYNKDALSKAGVTAPSADPAQRWTWEQTEAAAKKAQAAGIKNGLLLEQVEAYYQLQPLVESAGGGSGITGKDMLTPDVANAGWKKAMQWYADSFASGLSPRGVGGFQTSPVFTNGDVAFFVGGPWDVGNFAGSATFDWGVAPMPYFEGGKQVTPTGSWSWGINPASKNKDAAKKFLEYAALDPAGNLSTTEKTTIIPANSKAAAEYLPTLEKLGGAKSAGVADLITYEIDHTAVARPVSVGYVQFESVMNKAFADIRNGAPVDARLTQATQQLKDAWSQLR
ncbi:ABC transporter substrate-binding protein [Leifsonia poae]|uniref:ABC transporter substrate-binding protein n=1 Tax=Leifsonia poae TaxID=110933 RepID=UPI001CBF7A97|nr:sugar ABC transporter substrate-binding protein [Leifsonia poae]